MALLEEYIDLYGKGMTSFAYTYVKDWGEAEEVVQEVFLTVFKKIDTFKGKSSVKTWLYSITANRCKDLLRTSYKRKTVVTDHIQSFMRDSNLSPDERLLAKTDSQQLANAILALPIKYREVIILYYYDELDTEEISQLLRVKSSTIRSRLQRARKLLEEKWKGGRNDE